MNARNGKMRNMGFKSGCGVVVGKSPIPFAHIHWGGMIDIDPSLIKIDVGLYSLLREAVS